MSRERRSRRRPRPTDEGARARRPGTPGPNPDASPYRQALVQLRRRAGGGPLLRRVSELVSLVELTTALEDSAGGDAAMDAILPIVSRELAAGRAALFARRADETLELRASRNLPPGTPPILRPSHPPHEITRLGPGDEGHDRFGLDLLVPIRRRDRLLGVLGLGAREGGRGFALAEQEFLRGVAASTASVLESRLLSEELRRVHRKLSVREFELHNLFDIGRELTGSFTDAAIARLVTTTAMGHFVVSRCALYVLGPEGLALLHERGLRGGAPRALLPADEAREALAGLLAPTTSADLPQGPLRLRLDQARLVLAVPLVAGTRVEGVLAIGERASGVPFSDEDREFAAALGRQALAALETARLLRLRSEKERQDRELQIAREIQHGLFPQQRPEVPGFEVAAASRSCYEVGGDSFDWIPLGADRLALVVADVSGKGTPASLLMASVHASVRALAGSAAPEEVVARLNRFLFANTQAGRFVTLFYAELDSASRRLRFVNAGHVPPCRVGPDLTISRLREGGPALGLIDEATYDVGEVTLESGDMVAIVTDGVTEANSPDDREFGDERVGEVLRELSSGTASAILDGLVAAVDEWAGTAGCSDDLTALVLKAL